MAAKGKTRATLSAIAITAALIAPRIATAALIDPRSAIAVKSPVHAEPIDGARAEDRAPHRRRTPRNRH